ncbi:unnamed protein product, partial [Sphenostylis stenocarpa]
AMLLWVLLSASYRGLGENGHDEGPDNFCIFIDLIKDGEVLCRIARTSVNKVVTEM